MANYQPPINPDSPNATKYLFAQMANGAADGRNDSVAPLQLYRLSAFVSAPGVLSVNAPSLPTLATATTALAAATSQSIDLHVALPGYLFPSRVYRTLAYVEVLTAFNVVTTPTITLGNAGDPDGLVTAAVGTLNATGIKNSPAAAEYAARPEAAYIPLIALATGGGNLSTITAGAMEIVIGYHPLPY